MVEYLTGNDLGNIDTFRRPVRAQPTGLSGLTGGTAEAEKYPVAGLVPWAFSPRTRSVGIHVFFPL
jgi:hypothetical protein